MVRVDEHESGVSPIGELIESGVARRLDAIDAERRALLEWPVIAARVALAQGLDDAVALRSRLAALLAAVEATIGIPVGD